ncbi:MAG: hypothetical protein HFI74_07640 [Lachnospiraceae bacterium]|jgi:hypothetical protein|nr:hypothetical protein [Lachnospiraceae bacterium]
MESLMRLDEFEAVSLEYQKIGNYIRKQDPFRYEEEYGRDFVHYTDEDLMDLFIRKFGHYKPSVLSVVFGKYRRFYGWCVERQYIFENPFENSKFLSYEYLVRMAAANGNVPYYSREYVVELCETQNEAAAYYKAIALSLFEGVKSYSQLARLKRTDLDIEKRALMVGAQRLVVSLELLEAFDMLRECAYLQIGERRLALDQDSDALILPLIRYGQQRSLSGENYRYLSNAISRKMKSLGLSASGLYESGIMDRLVKHFGSEEILTYLLPEHPLEKKWMTQKNRELEGFFRENGISLSGRDFSFDFKGYGLLLKYGEILQKRG